MGNGMKWVADSAGGISCDYEGCHLHVRPMGEHVIGEVTKPGFYYRVAPQKSIEAACKAASTKAEALRASEGGAQ